MFSNLNAAEISAGIVSYSFSVSILYKSSRHFLPLLPRERVPEPLWHDDELQKSSSFNNKLDHFVYRFFFVMKHFKL